MRIEPWGPDDGPLLERLLGDAMMTRYLGGPETPEKIAERQARYERDPRQFRIVDGESGEPAGSVGYWERTAGDGTVFEIGWAVVPAFQGRGLASAATAQALERAREERLHRYVHAYPSVENGPSNAICRKLGFALLEEQSYEYPPGSGNVMVCNDWRFDLFAGS